MKTFLHELPRTAILAIAISIALLPSSSRAQGSLTPPGAPAPTMKSLAQIEPRTPISSLPYTITNSGAYYFVTNLTLASGNGILIQANNVTIDLNDFVMSGTSASANSGIIAQINVTNLCVRNGTVTDWHSTAVGGFRTFHSQYEKLRLINCEIGIDTGPYSVVQDCDLSTAASFNVGIRAGTNSVVKNCAVTGYPFGITSGDGCSIVNCMVRSNTTGMDLGAYCVIKDCVVAYSRFNGVQVQSNSVISANQFIQNGGSFSDAGILALGGGFRIEKNYARRNAGTGIAFSGTNNIVINNSSSGNGGANYNPASGSGFGPVQDPATATNPFANF